MSTIPTEPVQPYSELQRRISDAQDWERQGQLALARRSYERILRSLGPADGELAVDLTRWIGRTFVPEGDLDAAIDCAELSLTVAQGYGSTAGVARALNLLATLHQQKGLLDDAVALYVEAKAHAAEIDEGSLVALIDLNLGSIANIRGELDAALSHYQASLEGLRASGGTDYLVHVLNNLGMLYTDQKRWDEASEMYEQALRCCPSAGAGIQVMVEINRAEMLVQRGALDDAWSACQSSLRLIRSIGDQRGIGELCKIQGIIARERGDLAAAQEYLQSAADRAAEREDMLLAAEVAREQAILFWGLQRNQETLACLNRAHRLFTQLRARTDLADVRARLHGLEATFLEIVQRWSESIESADQYTRGHCSRVADHACALARRVGFDEQTLFWFRMGALLHDVGKMVIPADILNKPGGFTPQERMLMERHPDAGVELLGEIEFPWDIRPMVRYHHERWAGGGYPTGICGEEIPLAARILALADVFDALTTDRPYRPAYSPERGLEIMRDEMRGFFDPALLGLWEELWQEGELQVDPQASLGRVGATEPDYELSAPERIRLVHLSLFPPTDAWGAGPSLAQCSGLETTRCGQLAEAIEQLRGRRFDALLIDRVLGDGVETLFQIREGFPDLAVVVVAEVDDEEFALRAIQAGAQDVLVRHQIQPQVVERTVRRAVERSRLQEELRSCSLLDELTGLYNRRGFFTVARQHLQLADRTGQRALLLYADLDGLKQVNDRYGHPRGDQALQACAGVLMRTFRKSDVVARIGGDEFVALVLESSAFSSSLLLRRLEENLRQAALAGSGGADVFLSYGVAGYDPAAPRPLEDLIEEADRAMYVEKRRRKSLAPADRVGLSAVVV